MDEKERSVTMKTITKQDFLNLSYKYATLRNDDERCGFLKGLSCLGIKGHNDALGNKDETPSMFFMLDGKDRKIDKDIEWILADSLCRARLRLLEFPENSEQKDMKKKKRCLKHLVKAIERIFDEAAH